jgi:hypothetical protein
MAWARRPCLSIPLVERHQVPFRGRHAPIKVAQTQLIGKVLQYDQDLDCVTPAGPFPQYCSTVLH